MEKKHEKKKGSEKQAMSDDVEAQTKDAEPESKHKELQSELKEKTNEVEQLKDQVLRIRADFENTKKRLEKRTEEFVKFANEALILEFLQVCDDLDRAVDSLDLEHDLNKVQDGIQMVSKRFHKILSSNGVEPIETKGCHFDPNLHEAVGEVITSDVPEGAIADELQKGYKLNGRLARPSRVRIAKKTE